MGEHGTDEATEALLDGRYRLGALIGEGAMAQVFRAEDIVLGRPVAVKLLRADHAMATVARVRSESQALAMLQHDNLVTLFDAHIQPGSATYLVLELIEGPTLAGRLADGPLDAEEALVLARDLAAALAAVHGARIVHRDVKPSNVLLAPPPAAGRPFRATLGDFGIAHLMDDTRLTLPGLVLGTAAYLAPEQVRGAPPGPAADIYALGLVLFEALTGRRPYPESTAAEAALARLSTPVPLPEALPGDWAELLDRMLRIDPADRPTAADIAAELADRRPATSGRPTRRTTAAPVAATEPVPAHTASAAVSARTHTLGAPPAHRARRPRRRTTMLAVLAAAVVLGIGMAHAWALSGHPAMTANSDRTSPVPLTPPAVDTAIITPVVDDGGEPVPPPDTTVSTPVAPAAPEQVVHDVDRATADAEHAAKEAERAQEQAEREAERAQEKAQKEAERAQKAADRTAEKSERSTDR